MAPSRSIKTIAWWPPMRVGAAPASAAPCAIICRRRRNAFSPMTGSGASSRPRALAPPAPSSWGNCSPIASSSGCVLSRASCGSAKPTVRRVSRPPAPLRCFTPARFIALLKPSSPAVSIATPCPMPPSPCMRRRHALPATRSRCSTPIPPRVIDSTQGALLMNPIPALTPHLKQLRLSGILDSLEARNRQAIESKLAYIEFLALLIEDEVARREQKKFASRLRRAAFRTNKTLDQFEFDRLPQLNRALVHDLASGRYLSERVPVLIEIAAAGKIVDQCAVELGQAVELELIERLVGAEGGTTKPRGELLLLAAGDFILDQQGEEFDVGKFGLDGLAITRLERIEDAGQTQLFQMRGKGGDEIHQQSSLSGINDAWGNRGRTATARCGQSVPPAHAR